MRLRRVVVGVDFSAASASAARWTTHVFAPDATLTFVHALETPRRGVFGWWRRAAEATDLPKSVSEASERFREFTRKIDATAAEVRVVNRVSAERGVAERIVSAANESSAELIVVARSNVERGRPQLLGSTAEEVIRRSRLPVVVAQDPTDEPVRRIIAAVDESVRARRIITAARAQAQRLGARLTLFHVTDAARYGPVFPITLDPEEHSVVSELQRESRDRLSRILRRLRVPVDEVDLEVTTGEPIAEITRAAERVDAGLIVLGGRRSGPIERTLLGSIASGVLDTAPCPVLVVAPLE